MTQYVSILSSVSRTHRSPPSSLISANLNVGESTIEKDGARALADLIARHARLVAEVQRRLERDVLRLEGPAPERTKA